MSVLPTFSDLPLASPAARVITANDSVQQTVKLGEITDRALLHIRGSEAEITLSASGMKIGDVVEWQSSLLVRLRRDEFVLLTHYGHEAMERLTGLIGDKRVTLTDLTHGRCGLLLVGKNAPRVLPKVCALDFADAAFTNLHAAQTSLAKVRTLIMRVDIEATPAYGLIVDRSLAQYVWGVAYDAGREFGIGTIGLENTRARGLW